MWTATAAVGVAGLLVMPPALAADDASGAAVGTASASGVRTSYDFPGFLVIDTIYDAGGPIAQSVVNSSDGGSSFASFPYPGDTIVNSPALANVGTGQAFPFTYPLYVVTDGNLTPKASAKDATGSLVLNAESAARTAQSTAKLAGPTAGVVNTAGSLQETSVVIGADGTMTSTADSLIRGVDVAGVLKLAEVHVRTVSVLKPGERKPTTTSTTDVIGASVLGTAVGLTKDGIALLGEGGQSPHKAAEDALNQALTNAGIAVALADDRAMTGGSSSAGVEILQKGKLPFEGSPVGVARTLIGNAASSIVGKSNTLAALAAPVASAPAVETPPPVQESVPPAATDPPPAFPEPIPLPELTTAAPDTVPAATRVLPTVRFVPQSAPVASVALDLEDELGFLYLAMAAGAAVASISALLWRAKGGRSA